MGFELTTLERALLQDFVEESGVLLGGNQIPICIGLKVVLNVSLILHDSAELAFDEVGFGSALSEKKISLQICIRLFRAGC